MNIKQELFKLKDDKYKDFHSKLLPTIDKNTIIGVRVPKARKLAKEYLKDEACINFLDDLPHEYFDENLIHALLLSEIKDYDLCIDKIESFLPYVDNWAICDILSPKIFKKHKNELIDSIKKWLKSKNTYTVRFALGMLMAHFLDEDFKEEYLIIPSNIHTEEYYINMMIAWYYATALAKQWEDTIIYLEDNILDLWVHNKTIQKACDSYRITKQQKTYLKTLKRKNNIV